MIHAFNAGLVCACTAGCSVCYPLTSLQFVMKFSPLPQLAQSVIDLNNQMQQKDKEMQMNEAK